MNTMRFRRFQRCRKLCNGITIFTNLKHRFARAVMLVLEAEQQSTYVALSAMDHAADTALMYFDDLSCKRCRTKFFKRVAIVVNPLDRSRVSEVA